jgi:hypothetical protein
VILTGWSIGGVTLTGWSIGGVILTGWSIGGVILRGWSICGVILPGSVRGNCASACKFVPQQFSVDCPAIKPGSVVRETSD